MSDNRRILHEHGNIQLEAIYHAGARAAQGAVSYVLRVPGISGALSFDDRAQAETAFEAATQRKL